MEIGLGVLRQLLRSPLSDHRQTGVAGKGKRVGYKSKLTAPVDRAVQVVKARYGLQAQVDRVRLGYMSTTLHLRGGGASYLLKVYRSGDVDPEQLVFGAWTNGYLRRSGIPAPELVCARDGAELVVEGENQFQLWAFVEGQVYTPGHRAQLQAAGTLLGRMHRAGKHMSISTERAWRPMWGAIEGELEETWCGLEDMPALSGELDRFRGCLEEVRSAVSEAALGALPACVIHGDYRAQNLLFRKDRIVAVLDLDGARPAQRLFDTAYAAVFFQAVVAPGPLEVDELRVFLQAYDREAGLTDGERALRSAFLKLSLLRGLTLWMRIAYLERVNVRAVDWIGAYLPFLEGVDRQGQALVERI